MNEMVSQSGLEQRHGFKKQACNASAKKSYWDNFYSRAKFGDLLQNPSDFAKFSLQHMRESDITRIVEFGCGNGRDTCFFLQSGLEVLAIDASSKAVEIAASYNAFGNTAQCFVHDVAEEFPREVSAVSRTALYARFLLHALNDKQIFAFFQNCKKSTKNDDILMVEYRTLKDAKREKVTAVHYRNYLSPEVVCGIASSTGFKCSFATEGVGYAKWMHDDAYVARQIFHRI